MLDFQEEGHVYTWEGNPVPSVTQVLDQFLSGYAGVPEHILQAAGERGTIVHKICELDDHGKQFEMPEGFDGYLEAWRQFKAAMQVEMELIEYPMYHKKLGYAGTLDRILMARPISTGRQLRALVDIKSWKQHMPTAGPQTAAYEALLKEELGMKVDERWAVRLTEDGKFYITPCNDRSDLSIFTSCLNLVKWKEKHNL